MTLIIHNEDHLFCKFIHIFMKTWTTEVTEVKMSVMLQKVQISAIQFNFTTQ